MNALNATSLSQRLAEVGAILENQGTPFTIIVVGGASLLLRGETDRVATGDVDILAAVNEEGFVFPFPLPLDLQIAVQEVADGYALSDDWMNAVVARSWAHSWPEGLPTALLSDVEWRTYGGLRVGLAGRSVLIPLKVHAVVDRSRVSGFDPEGRVATVDLSPSAARRHLQDLVAMQPTEEELETARTWVKTQDGSPQLDVFLDTITAHVRDAR